MGLLVLTEKKGFIDMHILILTFIFQRQAEKKQFTYLSKYRRTGGPRTRWRDYISHLAWERLGISLEELESVAGEKVAWGALLSRLPRDPARISG